MPGRTPRNEEGQRPTRTPDETAKRLDEKAKDLGGANKRRAQTKAQEAKGSPMTDRMKRRSS